MKVYVVTTDIRNGKPSAHWSKEAAEQKRVTNTEFGENRKVHEVELGLANSDGSYFVALATTTEMAQIALEINNVMTGDHHGDVFERMAKAEALFARLRQMKKEFAL